MLDQLNLPTNRDEMTRGQRIWDDLRPLRETASLSLERARLVTAAYKETEGQPIIFRRAHAHEKILANIPIHIDNEQLLCGDFASEPMGFEWWPELYSRWVSEAIDNGWFTYKVLPDQINEIHEIVNYWKGRGSRQGFLNYLDPDFKATLDTMNEKGSLCFFAETEASLEKGWHVPNSPAELFKTNDD